MDKLIKDLTLYVDNRLATSSDKKIFFQFIKNLRKSKNVRFIYRGENNLNKHYNTDISNIPVLCQHIFLVGEKGKIFREEHFQEANNMFHIIWDKINKIVFPCSFKRQSQRFHVSNFIANNPEFEKYFSKEDNYYHFLEFNSAPIDVRNKIIDYYISLFHTMEINDNSNSYYLSSSSSIKVAHNFSNGGIILFGWIPTKDINNRSVAYKDVSVNVSFIQSLGLPTYQVPVFPRQNEICLKCGLLPHFIIGFKYENCFYINPTILNPWHDDIIYNGLDINQTDFFNNLTKTNYKSAFYFIDGYYYVEADKTITKI